MHIKLLSPAAFLSHKCTKYRLAAGLRPDPLGELTALPHGGAYSAPPDHLAELKGPTSKGRGGVGVKKEGKGGEGEERKGEGKGRGRGL